MDSEAEFQIQPSSSGEALELLLGAGLDRVQAANLLAGSDSGRSKFPSKAAGTSRYQNLDIYTPEESSQ